MNRLAPRGGAIQWLTENHSNLDKCVEDLSKFEWGTLGQDDPRAAPITQILGDTQRFFPRLRGFRAASFQYTRAAGMYDVAVDIGIDLVRSFPETPGIRVDLARLLTILERFDEAQYALRDEEHLGNDSADFHFAKSILFGFMTTKLIAAPLNEAQRQEALEFLSVAEASADAAFDRSEGNDTLRATIAQQRNKIQSVKEML